MNAPVAPEEESNVPEPDGPGRQLRTMREAQGLDLSQVAAQLHLSDSLLQSLEADNYESMAGTVFVQGYLRNYARLLGIDVATVLESFESARSDQESAVDLTAANVKHEVRSSHLLVRLITWLIVIGLIGLLVVWWRGYLQWPLQLDGFVEDTPTVGEPVDVSEAVNDPSLPIFTVPTEALGAQEATDGPESETSPSDKSGTNTPEPVLEPEPELESRSELTEEAPLTQTDDTPLEPAANTTTPIEVAEPTVDAAPIEQAVLTESVVEASPALPEVAPLPEVSLAEPVVVEAVMAAAVVISFSGDCWVDIKGANGSYRWFGSKKAGDQLVLGGEAPYTLLLGNAAVSSIEIGGEAFDLTPHTRGNVARFTLELN